MYSIVWPPSLRRVKSAGRYMGMAEGRANHVLRVVRHTHQDTATTAARRITYLNDAIMLKHKIFSWQTRPPSTTMPKPKPPRLQLGTVSKSSTTRPSANC